jgi:hypothetical protein
MTTSIRNGGLARPRRGLVLLALAAMAPAMGGCYGTFPLTKTVYEFNGKVTDSKVVHSLVFWGFVILPVYDIAILGDAIVFNLIEFWTGDKPSAPRVMLQPDGTEVSFSCSGDGRQAFLVLSREGTVLSQAAFRRVAAERCSMGEGERDAGTQRTAAGSPQF